MNEHFVIHGSSMAESFQDRIKEVSDERVLFAYLADGTFLNANG
jgi:hypothetical protein